MKPFPSTQKPRTTALVYPRLRPSPALKPTLLTAPYTGAEMMELGSFPDASATTAYALSGDGNVVVGSALVGIEHQPFRWSADHGFFSLGVFSVPGCAAYGVSRQGRFIVGAGALVLGSHSLRAFCWDALGGLTNVGALGGTRSAAYGVSDDGAVVVGFADGPAFSHACLWQAGTLQGLGSLTAHEHSVARGVSGDGAVVVGRSGSEAFRWHAATEMVGLGTLGGASSAALAANRDGSVVVGNSQISGSEYPHAFRWTAAGGMQDLGTLGGLESIAHAVSADGSVVVGGAFQADGAYRAFRWSAATGMTNLGVLTGETNSWASGVSDDGNTVVGNSGHRVFIWQAQAGIEA